MPQTKNLANYPSFFWDIVEACDKGETIEIVHVNKKALEKQRFTWYGFTGALKTAGDDLLWTKANAVQARIVAAMGNEWKLIFARRDLTSPFWGALREAVAAAKARIPLPAPVRAQTPAEASETEKVIEGLYKKKGGE